MDRWLFPKLRDAKLEAWFETVGTATTKQFPFIRRSPALPRRDLPPIRLSWLKFCDMWKSQGKRRGSRLFAGSGNFSLALAASGKTVTAIEIGSGRLGRSRALRSMNRASKLKSLKKISTDPTRMLSKVNAWLVDPPRSGLKSLIATIAGIKTSKRLFMCRAGVKAFWPTPKN